jgi:hypothetical protein
MANHATTGPPQRAVLFPGVFPWSTRQLGQCHLSHGPSPDRRPLASQPILMLASTMQEYACIIKLQAYYEGMAKETHRQQRPTCGDAGGALFVVCGDRLAVRTRGVHPRNVSSNLAPCTIVVSGTATAETVTAPDHQPRDLAPKKMTTQRNIAPNRSIFHTAAQPPQMSDLARHEQPSSRQTN